MALEVGSTIGDYKIIGSLGAGGMGRVFRVQNLISHRIEAMKVLLPDLSENTDLAERFMREIQVQASLVHPNICALHTALRLDNQLVMVMELVEGDTLEKKLKDGPLPVNECLTYATQILSALAYAHERKVIHRDLKPANIIISNDTNAKLMDFGLAAAIAGGDKRLTKTGTVMGSLYYMSPEQVKGEAPTERSDVYSFGLTLYEMLTGVRCIQGDSDYSIMTAQLMHMPEAPVRLNSGIPVALSNVVLKSIAKDPALRLPSAAAFRTALHEYSKISNAPTVVMHAGDFQPVAASAAVPPAKPRSRTPMLIAGGAIAAVLVAGALFYRSSSIASSTPASNPPVPAVQAIKQVPDAPSEPVATTDSAPPAQPKPATTTPVADTPIKTPPKQFSVPQAKVVEATPPAPVTVASVPTPKPVVAENPPAAPAATPPSPIAISSAPQVIKSPQQQQNEEWDSLKGTRDPKALRDFQSRYPAGSHAAEAVAMAERLEHDAARGEIAEVLKRYEAAYGDRDIIKVRALWPGAPNAIATFFNNSRSAKITLQPSEPNIKDDHAVVPCKYSLAAQMTDGSRQKNDTSAVVHLVHTRGAWMIEDIEYK